MARAVRPRRPKAQQPPANSWEKAEKGRAGVRGETATSVPGLAARKVPRESREGEAGREDGGAGAGDASSGSCPAVGKLTLFCNDPGSR